MKNEQIEKPMYNLEETLQRYDGTYKDIHMTFFDCLSSAFEMAYSSSELHGIYFNIHTGEFENLTTEEYDSIGKKKQAILVWIEAVAKWNLTDIGGGTHIFQREDGKYVNRDDDVLTEDQIEEIIMEETSAWVNHAMNEEDDEFHKSWKDRRDEVEETYLEIYDE